MTPIAKLAVITGIMLGLIAVFGLFTWLILKIDQRDELPPFA